MEKKYKLELNIFDLDTLNCETFIKKFLDEIDYNEKFCIELVKNNTNIIQNISNINNVILFSKNLSQYKKNITKIIINTDDKDDFLLNKVIYIVKNVLSSDIEKFIEFKIQKEN